MKGRVMIALALLTAACGSTSSETGATGGDDSPPKDATNSSQSSADDDVDEAATAPTADVFDDQTGPDVDDSDPLPTDAPPWPPHACDEAPTTPPAPTGSSWAGADPFVIETLEHDDHVSPECALIEDLDGDGALDLVLAIEHEDLNGSLLIRWGVDADGGPAVAAQTSVPFPEDYNPTTACTVADVDDDGDLDILVGSDAGDVMVARTTGARTIEPVVDAITLPDDANWLAPITLVPTHLDDDGAIDLVVATRGKRQGCPGADDDPGGGADVRFFNNFLTESDVHCLLGSSDGTFAPAAPGAVCPDLEDTNVGNIWSGSRPDLDHDGAADLILARTYTHNAVLLTGGGALSDATDASGLTIYNHAMGLGLADFDGDGRRDLYISDTGPDQLWRGTGCGTWETAPGAAQLALDTDRSMGWGTAAVDFDLDGDVDVFVANGEVRPPEGFLVANFCQPAIPAGPELAHYLHINDGAGHFTKTEIPYLEDLKNRQWHPTVARADLDHDGDPDLLVAENGAARVYWNQMGDGHWLAVRPLDAEGRPVPGARVRVRQGDTHERWVDLQHGAGRDGCSPAAAHFGLGTDGSAATVAVRWPDGAWTVLSDEAVDRELTVTR